MIHVQDSWVWLFKLNKYFGCIFSCLWSNIQRKNEPNDRVFLSYVCALMCLAAQPCPTLCDPLDCRPPKYSIHGIFQARILKWIVISFSRWFSQLKDQTCVSCVPCIAGVIRAKLFLFICFYKISMGCYHQGFLCSWLKFGTQKSSTTTVIYFPIGPEVRRRNTILVALDVKVKKNSYM